MGTESLRALAANLKEAYEAVLQEAQEADALELEETLHLEKLPSYFWWRLELIWYGPGAPRYFLHGTPVVWSRAHKIINCAARPATQPELDIALGKLFGFKSTTRYLGIFDSELRVDLAPQELLHFLRRSDVNFQAASRDANIKQLEKIQEELDEQSCVVFEYLHVLHNRRR